MKKLTLTLMAISIGLLLSVPAFAFGPGSGCGQGGGMGQGYYGNAGFNKLNLTDEQKTKIESLQAALQKEIAPLREKIFDKSVELRRLWLKADLDKEKITAVQKEVRVLRDEIQDKVTAKLLEMSKVLTPEQREKLANSRWGRGGFGPRGGMRGPGHGGFGPGMGMYN